MPKHLETAPAFDPNTMPIPQLEPDTEPVEGPDPFASTHIGSVDGFRPHMHKPSRNVERSISRYETLDSRGRRADLEERTRNTRTPGDELHPQEAPEEHLHGRHVGDALAARALQRTQRGTLYEPIAPAPTLPPPATGSFYQMR